MIPGYLINKKTSWRFDDLGGFRATFLGPKLDFFSCDCIPLDYFYGLQWSLRIKDTLGPI